MARNAARNPLLTPTAQLTKKAAALLKSQNLSILYHHRWMTLVMFILLFISLVFLGIFFRMIISPHAALEGMGSDYNGEGVAGRAERRAYYAGKLCECTLHMPMHTLETHSIHLPFHPSTIPSF